MNEIYVQNLGTQFTRQPWKTFKARQWMRHVFPKDILYIWIYEFWFNYHVQGTEYLVHSSQTRQIHLFILCKTKTLHHKDNIFFLNFELQANQNNLSGLIEKHKNIITMAFLNVG